MRILIFTSVLGIIGSIAVLIAVIIKAQKQNAAQRDSETPPRPRH
jgi:hypothetical protein